jgi:hypothetical protein
MRDIKEMEEIKDFLTRDHHGERVKQQKVDLEYYQDKVRPPQIKSDSPITIVHTGTPPWLIDGPSAHIITRNPQAFVKPKKMTDGGKGSAYRVNLLLNHWMDRILKQSPQPLKQLAKNLMLYGEAWVHPVLNNDWNPEMNDRGFLPILFPVPNPVNVFGAPAEDYGIPEYVVVVYKRLAHSVAQKYPEWAKRRPGVIDRGEEIEWWEFWDEETRCFFADGAPVWEEGPQPNIYKFVPYIHAYSGFGNEDPDAKPEELAVGRLRKVRDLLNQECAMNSDTDGTLHMFAHPRIDIFPEPGQDYNVEQIRQEYTMGAGMLNVVPLSDPNRFREGTRILPTKEAFQHYYNIRTRIAMEAPPIMSGLPSGTSGRQEDITGYHFIRRFDSVVEAIEDMVGKMLDMGRKMLPLNPNWMPVTQWLEQPEGGQKEIKIAKDDLDACTETRVHLKAADPIEDDRKLMAGRALVETGRIDWETFLIDHVGYTPEKAKETMMKTIAEKVVLSNPMILQIIAQKAMEKLGMTEELQALQQQAELQQQMGEALAQQPTQGGERGGEPRRFNEQSPEAREMVDVMLSQRGVRRGAR